MRYDAGLKQNVHKNIKATPLLKKLAFFTTNLAYITVTGLKRIHVTGF